jgi:hypothetical protein
MHVLPIFAGQVAFAHTLAARVLEGTPETTAPNTKQQSGTGSSRSFKTRYRRDSAR